MMSTENFERVLEISASEANSIPTLVGAWWKDVSVESQTTATPGKLYAVGNYLIELVKNSLGDGKSDGKVTVIFDSEKIKLVIEDFGSEDKKFNLNISGDYGFKEVIEYSDVIMIEAGGRKYEKDSRNHMQETDDCDLYKGSRMTFIKYILAPPAEEDEVTYRGRDFQSRM